MTIKVDILNKDDEVLFIEIEGEGLKQIAPGGGITEYIYEGHGIKLFADRRKKLHGYKVDRRNDN